MNRNKYLTIYQTITREILEGKYPYQSILPSENKLVEMYDVSRETVRKALSLLQSNGYIQKLKGKGSVVIFNEANHFPVSQLISFKEIQESLNLHYETIVERFEVVSAKDFPHVQQALKLGDYEKLWKVVRCRVENGKTAIVDTDYFIQSLMPALSEEVAQQSIYEYIEDRLGLTISFSNKAITFEPFDDDDFDYFGETNPPYAAVVRSVVHLDDTRPFQYNVSKHRANEFKFVDFSRRISAQDE